MDIDAGDPSAQRDQEALLPGERLLWSGRRARLRRSPSEYLMMCYLLVFVPVFGLGFVWPIIGQKVGGAAAVPLQVLWSGALTVTWLVYLWYLLVRQPRDRRSEVYRITDLRILVSSGVRRRSTVSAWLYQLQEPVVRGSGADADVLFGPAESRGLAAVVGAFRATMPAVPGREPVSTPVFHTLTDAEAAREVASTARRALLDGSLEPPQALLSLAAVSLPVPAEAGLGAGERVLWTDSPARTGWWFGGADVFASLSWAGFAAFVVAMGLVTTLAGGAPPPLLAVALAVGGLGLGWEVARLLLRRRRAAGCRYVLTDVRLITSWGKDGRVSFSTPVTGHRPPSVRAGSVLADPVVRPALRRGATVADRFWPFRPGQPPALVGLRDPAAWAVLAAAQFASWHSRHAAAPRPR